MIKTYSIIITSVLFIFVACQTDPNDKNKILVRKKKEISDKAKSKGDELISYNGYPLFAKNLSLVNSEYDDYNSAKPGDGERSTFLFSSNRNSRGKDFDIIQYNALSFFYNYSSRKATVRLDNGFCSMSSNIKTMLKKVNTSKNEYGPYVLDLKDNFEFLLFYAHEETDKLQLKFMANKLDSKKGYTCYLNEYGPYDINLINDSKCNVAYISIQNSVLYYCSDKTGDFDIYQHQMDTSINTATEYIGFLTKKSQTKSKGISKLNSNSDDKCPYIFNDFMVFSSNRKSGYGGYDLWYSRFENNEWTEPINFGPKINTKYDEFRPIVSINTGVPNDLMIFSSNRPNGKGGFDLYYVGISETRKWNTGYNRCLAIWRKRTHPLPPHRLAPKRQW